MEKTILTDRQIKLLNLFSNLEIITSNFYLSGGTALAEFYLKHRYSEDLDFFSETEVDPLAVSTAIKKIQKEGGIKKIDYQQSFNRNLFFLHCEKEIIKTEFTFYPFTQIEKGLKHHDLKIDSLIDIATNKVFTIYQKPRCRDFIDLFFILKKKNFKLEDLVKKARIKFDWQIDPLQLGSQYMKALELKDYPNMINKIDDREWQNFFLNEAEKLGKNVLK